MAQTIPSPILALIFEQLDIGELIASFRVCHRWHSISLQSSLWNTLTLRDYSLNLLSTNIPMTRSFYIECYRQQRAFLSGLPDSYPPLEANCGWQKCQPSLQLYALIGDTKSLKDCFTSQPDLQSIILSPVCFLNSWNFFDGAWNSESYDGFIYFPCHSKLRFFQIAKENEWVGQSGHSSIERFPDMKGIYFDGNLIHWACLAGHLETVKYLLSLAPEGIDATLTHSEFTALDIAKVNGHRKLARFLADFPRRLVGQ